MRWPVVTRNEDGRATVTINGQVAQLGPLAALDADRTAVMLRGIIELLLEATATPPNAARVAALRTLLGQLRDSL